jgi:deoxycytidylate deaminase
MWSRARRTTRDLPPASPCTPRPTALLYAGVDGCRGSTLYLTAAPCDGCLKLIAATGIERVVWHDQLYRIRVASAVGMAAAIAARFTAERKETR